MTHTPLKSQHCFKVSMDPVQTRPLRHSSMVAGLCSQQSLVEEEDVLPWRQLS
jgi:hypothetical protein